MSKSFEDLLSKVSECEMKKVAVAVAQDSAVLEAVAAAKERGIAEAILVGDEDKIKEVAEADKVEECAGQRGGAADRKGSFPCVRV